MLLMLAMPISIFAAFIAAIDHAAASPTIIDVYAAVSPFSISCHRHAAADLLSFAIAIILIFTRFQPLFHADTLMLPSFCSMPAVYALCHADTYMLFSDALHAACCHAYSAMPCFAALLPRCLRRDTPMPLRYVYRRLICCHLPLRHAMLSII